MLHIVNGPFHKVKPFLHLFQTNFEGVFSAVIVPVSHIVQALVMLTVTSVTEIGGKGK